jgi:hypothetical protein
MIMIAKIFEKIVSTRNLGLSRRKLPFSQGAFPTHENCFFWGTFFIPCGS